MAKRKKTKASDSKTLQYSVELTGLILILIGVIGFGFGLIGKLIKQFAMFLVGEWWWLLLILLLLLGIHMVFKRKLPKFFSTRLIGFYIVIIIILIASHFTFIEKCGSAKEMFEETINNYMERANSMPSTGGIISAGQSNIAIGGGIIGCLFGMAFYTLFGMTGTKIVIGVLGVFGFIMLFDLNMGKVWEKIRQFFSAINPKRFMKRKEEVDDDDEGVVITSAEKIKHSVEEIPPVVEEQIEIKPKSKFDSNYLLPPLSILEDPKKNTKNISTDFIKNSKNVIERVLEDFGVKGKVVEIHTGPAVTQFEISVPSGTKVSRVANIQGELKMALAAREIRIQAPIPGKSTIGVEIPNPEISEVRIKEILANVPRNQANANILVSLGKDIMGRVQTTDISKTPHLLVAGSTGSGKSVCINNFIISILMKYRPDEVKLVLIDPKKVELSNYNGIPHLLTPVVTDPKQANVSLQRIVREMDRRYNLFTENGVKNIAGYNDYAEKQNKKGNDDIDPLPYIVVIIDELADLMLIAAKEVEESILRITQLARAAGIHLIVATQRPSTDVITGIVKANIPSRLAFSVSSSIDSRTILDATGAEKLLGKGDMLFQMMGENSPIRIQGAFVSDREISNVIDYVKNQQDASYDDPIMNSTEEYSTSGPGGSDFDDPLYDEIVEFAIKSGKLSASLLQRRFRLGYNRAARIVDMLEERGIIGPQNGSKPREVLVKQNNESEE